MPDYRFPESKTQHGLHSGIHTLLGVEQQSIFQSAVESKPNAWRGNAFSNRLQPDVNHSLLKSLSFHADPLAPLRQRDEQALDDIFDDAQVDEIVADICLRLQQLCPEPCWEDDAFEFLKEYV